MNKNILPFYNKGFTAIEVITTLIILGIISAVAIPNLLGQKHRQELKNDVGKISGLLSIALRNADRTSQSVTINFPSGTSPIITAELEDGKNAFMETLQTSEHTVIKNGLILEYNFRGEKSTDTEDLLIIESSRVPDKYCIVFSLLMFREGLWNGTNCINPENLRYDNQ